MNIASPAGVPSSSFLPCTRRGLAPDATRDELRPLPGRASSAVLVLDFDPFEDSGFLFPTIQPGEALVMRQQDEFGLLMGLALAIPAGLAVWAIVTTLLIAL